MVETIWLIGKQQPSYGNVLKDIHEGKFQGISYIPSEPLDERVSKLLRLTKENNIYSYIHMHFDVKFNFDCNPVILSNKIGFFSIYGCNGDAFILVDMICDKFGCGYESDSPFRKKRLPSI